MVLGFNFRFLFEYNGRKPKIPLHRVNQIASLMESVERIQFQMLSPEERAVNRRQTIERMLEDERRNIQVSHFVLCFIHSLLLKTLHSL